MSRHRAASWESEDLDPAWEGHAEGRAKPVVRRVPARWTEEGEVFVATIDRWSVRVGRGPRGAAWEWSAFSLGRPKALRCIGFGDAESARRDAESTLAEQV